MAKTDSQFSLIKCDGPKCTKKAVMIEVSDPVTAAKVVKENPWLDHLRVVSAGNKKMPNGQPMLNQYGQPMPNQYFFCSDPCVVDAAAAGMFTYDVEKSIVTPEGSPEQAIRDAANAKANLDAVDKGLREGSGAKIQVVPR